MSNATLPDKDAETTVANVTSSLHTSSVDTTKSDMKNVTKITKVNNDSGKLEDKPSNATLPEQNSTLIDSNVAGEQNKTSTDGVPHNPYSNITATDKYYDKTSKKSKKATTEDKIEAEQR